MRVILPQIALITQRNAASCIIAQTKTVRDGDVRLLKFWGVSAIICERYWGSRALSTKEETQETVAARMQQTVTVSHFVASQATTKI